MGTSIVVTIWKSAADFNKYLADYQIKHQAINLDFRPERPKIKVCINARAIKRAGSVQYHASGWNMSLNQFNTGF